MPSFFDHPYYKWNKRFLRIIGTWPEQSFFVRCFLPFVICAAMFTIVVPELIGLWTVLDDINALMDSVPPLLTMGVFYVQLINGSVNSNKFKKMIDKISSDWERLGESPNIEIIEKYAAQGCFLTKLYTVCLYTAAFLYITLPAFPIIMDVVAPLNESRKRLFLYRVEYGVDCDDYYWWIFAHASILSWTVVVVIISSDVMYFVVVEHACALFDIVKINLQTIEKYKGKDGFSLRDRSYEIICRCADLHRDAIIFSELIESSYSVSFVGVIGFCILNLSISGVQTVMHIDKMDEALRYGSFSLAQIFHLYCNSVPGQKIIDYSLSIFDYAYAVDWHEISPKARKLLIVIMMRSLRPCRISAGKIYIVSMESYSAVMQTSMSYFTVFSSMC